MTTDVQSMIAQMTLEEKAALQIHRINTNEKGLNNGP